MSSLRSTVFLSVLGGFDRGEFFRVGRRRGRWVLVVAVFGGRGDAAVRGAVDLGLVPRHGRVLTD
jgi:hypothetical protein